MAFVRDRLPEALPYFESEGLRLTGPGKWKTAKCDFHGGSDSMRINTETGAFVCMSGCGAKGGDVVAYRMLIAGVDFVQACKDLDAWQENDRPSRMKPLPFSAREALSVLRFEALLAALAAGNIAKGIALTDDDLKRLLQAASRIEYIAEEVG